MGRGALAPDLVARSRRPPRGPRRHRDSRSHVGRVSARPLGVSQRNEVRDHAPGHPTRDAKLTPPPGIHDARRAHAGRRHRRQQRDVQHRQLGAAPAAAVRAVRGARVVHVRCVQRGQSGVDLAARLPRLPRATARLLVARRALALRHRRDQRRRSAGARAGDDRHRQLLFDPRRPADAGTSVPAR